MCFVSHYGVTEVPIYPKWSPVQTGMFGSYITNFEGKEYIIFFLGDFIYVEHKRFNPVTRTEQWYYFYILENTDVEKFKHNLPEFLMTVRLEGE